MRAMVLEKQRSPLVLKNVPRPSLVDGQILIRVTACGICRTDLHVVDGELKNPVLPLIPGHQIVGNVEEVQGTTGQFQKGDRVGVPWLGRTCGTCVYCRSEKENLCDHPLFTGYQIQGGFAEFAVADARFCFRIPDHFSDLNAAPLLCAGFIGFRSLRMVGNAQRLGIFGFGAAAHIVCQIALFQKRDLYAFTRPGDMAAQRFARDLGAVWAGNSDEHPSQELDAAIIFAPVGALVPAALKAVAKGGAVVCGGIHMSDIPTFPYEILWGERSIKSVANLTREDGNDFLELAAKIPIKTEIEVFPLEETNMALDALRSGQIRGAGVIRVQTIQ